MFVFIIVILILITFTACSKTDTKNVKQYEEIEQCCDNTTETANVAYVEEETENAIPNVESEILQEQVETIPLDAQDTPTVVEDFTPTEVKQAEQENLDRYTLKQGMSYYDGEMDMSYITSITFARESPIEYDEKWFANITDTDDIVGYRVGTEVFIVGDKIYFNESCGMMFCVKSADGDPVLDSLTEVNGLDIIDTSKVKRMSYMFCGGENFKHLDVGKWDVSNVENMKMMFAGCTNLEFIDVSNWDVSNVSNFTAMFQGSDHAGDMKLKEIDVSKWNTNSATKMGHMFYGCGALETIAVDSWNVSNVTTFTHMFADCFPLKSLNILNWDTTSVESFNAFLNDCRNLETIDISGLETSTCKQFSQMFESCSNLTKIIGIETMDVSNASYYAFSEMFHGCTELESLDLSKWDTSKADNMARMFAGCSGLKELDLSSFDLSNVWTFEEMFEGCSEELEIVGDDINNEIR